MRRGAGLWAPLCAAVAGLLVSAVATAAVLAGQDAVTRAAPADDAAALEASRNFLDGYVEPDGRVVRRDQGGDTVSEGQAYAMLVAAAIGDEALFRRVWSWTQVHLERPDRLFSWHWADGEVVDPQPASDADLDIVRALLVGSRAFDEPALELQALTVAEAIRAHETVLADKGREILVAGPWARERRVVNPSYFAPRTFGLLLRQSGDRAWESMARSARITVADLVAISPHRPPDWATVGEAGRAVATPPPSRDAQQPAFGLDAQRLPVRYAESCASDDRVLAARLWPIMRADLEAGTMGQSWTMDGTPQGSPHALTWVSAAAAATAAGDRPARDRLLDEAETAEGAFPSYYGAAWLALGRLMLQTQRLEGCALQG